MSESSSSLSQRRHPYLPGLWLAIGFLALASVTFMLRPFGVTPSTVTESAAKVRIEKLKKADQVTPYDGVVDWFTQNNALEIADETDAQTYLHALQAIAPLKKLIERYQPSVASEDLPFLMEFVLWALVEFKRLSKQKTAGGMSFNDLYDSLLKGI